MRVRLSVVIACTVFMHGCTPKAKIAQTNFEAYVFKPSVTSKTISLLEAAESCKSFFPDFQSFSDDGDKNFSVSGSVNVLLDTPNGRVVCSVDSNSGRMDRVHDGVRSYSADEYARIAAEKKDMLEATRQKMLAIKEDARSIAAGNSSAFIKKAKRAVSDGFKDPDSAKFRDMYLSNKAVPTLCGQVNAKNSYGGYVGYKRFYYNDLSTYVEGIGEVSSSNIYTALQAIYCSEKFTDVE